MTQYSISELGRLGGVFGPDASDGKSGIIQFTPDVGNTLLFGPLGEGRVEPFVLASLDG